MKCLSLPVFLCTLTSGLDVTPVQKVIQLLEDMKKNGVKEMEAEQAQYENFKKFCENTLVEKDRAINEADQKINVLKADIQKAASDFERLETEIKGHQAELDKSIKEQADASKVRETERTDFSTTLKDYTESIDAIGRAIKSLKEQNVKRKQAAPSLLQLASSKLIPEETKRGIDALLMESAVLSQAPQAAGYEFQSGGVIQMLEKLQNKFVDERVSLEKDETRKNNAYELLVQGLKSSQAQSTKLMAEKTDFKGKAKQAKADAESSLSDITKAREADKQYRTDLSITCDKKAGDFASRQKLRKEELEAIGKASEIISGSAVSGTAAKHLPSLIEKQGTALASLRAVLANPARAEVARFLQQEAHQLNSRVLSALAVKIGASPDLSIIDDVKNMIQSLIQKLNKEAADEATKKAYCDKELSANEQTRTAKSETSASLKADIDKITASLATMAQEIADAGKDITELDAAMGKATELRQKEKAKNQQTVQDAVDAQSAVAQALTVLREFYEKASEATSLVQQSDGQPAAPEIFDTPYQGLTGSSGGVLGMLEVIQSDFARLEAQTTAAEEAGKKEHENFLEDSKVDKSKKKAEIEHKTAKTNEQKLELSNLKNDLVGVQKELDAANAYFEKLKPDCVDAGVSYEKRKAQREQEIKDLEEALVKLGVDSTA
jgi:DNA repair exonuclease SbcCD ATPase subunit